MVIPTQPVSPIKSSVQQRKDECPAESWRLSLSPRPHFSCTVLQPRDHSTFAVDHHVMLRLNSYIKHDLSDSGQIAISARARRGHCLPTRWLGHGTADLCILLAKVPPYQCTFETQITILKAYKRTRNCPNIRHRDLDKRMVLLVSHWAGRWLLPASPLRRFTSEEDQCMRVHVRTWSKVIVK